MAVAPSFQTLKLSKASITPRTILHTPIEEMLGNGAVIGTREAVRGVNLPPSTSSRTPKLRDSCDACAVAKVRCSKKRPTCTRCGKRGLTCEYVATKRAGRPSRFSTQSTTKVCETSQDPQQNDAHDNVTVISPLSSCMNTPPEGTFSASSMHDDSFSLQQQMLSYQDTVPNLLNTSMEPAIDSSTLESFSAELDCFLPSLGRFSGLETPPSDRLSLSSPGGSVSKTLNSNDTAALIPEHDLYIPENNCSDAPFSSNLQILAHREPLNTSAAEEIPAGSLHLSCYCLTTVLGFLRELIPNPSKAYPQSDEWRLRGAAGSSFASSQWLVAENERVAAAMDSVLQCSCSKDIYLLTVLSLVVFKILDRYAAAGEAALTAMTMTTMADRCYQSSSSSYHFQTRSPSQGAGSSSLCIDSEDSGRVVAQMVLSELHKAQRLMNQLMVQFQAHRLGAGVAVEAGDATNSPNMKDTLCGREDTSMPFSTAMLAQLEADLRRRLRTVSLKIVDTIRQA